MSIKFALRLHETSDSWLRGMENRKNGLWLEGSNGASVILIHGLTGMPGEMKMLATALNEAGYSTIIPLLANHGKTLSVLKRTAWRDFYSSVRDAFMKIKGPAGAKGPIFVVGLCFGALLGLQLTDEFPDEIAGISCLAPTFFYDGWNTPWSSHLLPLAYKTPLKHFFYFKENSPYGVKNRVIRGRIHRYYSHAGLNDLQKVAEYGYPYFPVTLLHQHHLLAKRIMKRLPYIHTPIQLIQARNDDVTSVKNSKYVYERVGSSVKEILLLENCYHLITVDEEHEKMEQSVVDFFNRLRMKNDKPQPTGSRNEYVIAR